MYINDITSNKECLLLKIYSKSYVEFLGNLNNFYFNLIISISWMTLNENSCVVYDSTSNE